MPNPLPLATAPETPNAPLFHSLTIRTEIDAAGKLVVSAQLDAALAHVDDYGTENEKWTFLGGANSTAIPDILALPSDLAHLAPDVAAAWPLLVGLCQKINAARKLA